MTMTGAQPAALHFMVESPPEGAVVDDEVRVDGWCVSDGDEPVAIRVRAGDQVVAAHDGIGRGDVAATYAHLTTAAHSGFAATLALPAGSYQIAIDAQAGTGDWRPLGARSITVRATPLRASLDTPPALTAQAGAIRFSGWCVHPKLRIADLRLAVG